MKIRRFSISAYAFGAHEWLMSRDSLPSWPPSTQSSSSIEKRNVWCLLDDSSSQSSPASSCVIRLPRYSMILSSSSMSRVAKTPRPWIEDLRTTTDGLAHGGRRGSGLGARGLRVLRAEVSSVAGIALRIARFAIRCHARRSEVRPKARPERDPAVERWADVHESTMYGPVASAARTGRCPCT